MCMRSAQPSNRKATVTLPLFQRQILNQTKRKIWMVPLAGLEPARISPLDFESSASTNFTTGALPGRLAQGVVKSNRQEQSAMPRAPAKHDAFAQQSCASLSQRNTIGRFRSFRRVTISSWGVFSTANEGLSCVHSSSPGHPPWPSLLRRRSLLKIRKPRSPRAPPKKPPLK